MVLKTSSLSCHQEPNLVYSSVASACKSNPLAQVVEILKSNMCSKLLKKNLGVLKHDLFLCLLVVPRCRLILLGRKPNVEIWQIFYSFFSLLVIKSQKENEVSTFLIVNFAFHKFSPIEKTMGTPNL